MLRLGRIALSLAALAAAVQLVRAAAVLPQRVASHFDLSGHADGWMDRGDFLLLWACLSAGIYAMFVALATFLPRLPKALINLPYRDYWLAPARRDTTLARAAGWLRWMGAATLALLTALLTAIAAAHAGEGEVDLGAWPWTFLGLYLAVMTALVLAMTLPLLRRV